MTCRAAELLMQHGLDAPLTPPERARLDAHVQDCAACRAAWGGYRRLTRETSDWVPRAAEREMPPAEFTAQVMARLHARPVPVPVWPRGLACGLTLALLAALSPLAAPWLPPSPPHWLPTPPLVRADGLWAAAQGVLAARWAVSLLLPALAANALFVLRARRAA